jgi:hypothetical protein
LHAARIRLLLLRAASCEGKTQKKVAAGWFLGGQKTKKYQGRSDFLRFFNHIFDLPSPRNAQKRDNKNSRKNRFRIFLVDFFVTLFRHDLFAKRFL